MICKAGHTTQMKAARIKLFKKEAYFFMIRGRLYMVCKLFFRLFAIGKQGGYFYMKTLNIIALTIGIIGAVNWGLIGFFNFYLVVFIFGAGWIARIIYGAVGLCGLYLLTFYTRSGEGVCE